nr:hypothetical protein BaRGS_000450 [Batillaria attramentaria]
MRRDIHISVKEHDKLAQNDIASFDVVQLKDGNTYEGRRLMWKAYQLWDKFRRVPPEVRVDKVTWLLSDMQHAEVEMRRLILDLIDEKVFGIQEGADEAADNARAVQDKVEQYNALQAKVDEAALLEGQHT